MRLGSVLRLAAIALVLNFISEMAQAPAFTGMPDGWWQQTAVCAQAAVGDVVIILTLWALAAMLFRDPRWFIRPTWARYGLIALVAVGLQVAIERIMVYRFHRWGYSAAQPLVPGVGVGVLPVLQGAVVPPFVFDPSGGAGSRPIDNRILNRQGCEEGLSSEVMLVSLVAVA